MVSVSGGGKDYTISNYIIPKAPLNTDVHVINRDPIRERLIGDDKWTYKKEKEVYKQFVRQIQEAINQGGIIVANATHLTDKSRLKLLRALDLSNIDCITFVILRRDLETCLERNSWREGKARIPEEAIRDQFAVFTEPDIKKYLEFGKVIKIQYF